MPLAALDRYQNFLGQYKDPVCCKKFLCEISANSDSCTLMEVCGTHTVALFRSGIRGALPENINMVSGPGCPVCVTSQETMETAIRLACKKDVVLYCFGDMLKVPGASGNLESAKAEKGAQVKIMYSPLDALEFAIKNSSKKVVLLAVGFETTVPIFASTVIRAKKQNVKNLFLYSAFKLVPPALDCLLSANDLNIDGFILPGHVSAIIGERAYQFMADKYNTSGVITGFEPYDMLEGITLLLAMIAQKKPEIKNQYARFVSKQGNQKAQALISYVFSETDAEWRGLGVIKKSGLQLNSLFEGFNAEQLIDFKIDSIVEPKGCLCAGVIKGKHQPVECGLFSSVCTPSNPIGPCMVSSEGTCAAYYKYGQRLNR